MTGGYIWIGRHIWHQTGEHSDWTSQELTMPTLNGTLVFLAIYGMQTSAKVAIDEIMVTEGECAGNTSIYVHAQYV